MPGLLPDVDPDGLLEYSVVFTDRSLNHMSKAFQGVMRDISATLKKVYNASSVAVVPGGGTFGMEAVARQFATGRKALVIRNGWFSYRWTQIFDMGGIPSESVVLKARPVAPGPQAAFAPAPIDEVVAAIRQHRPDVVFAPHVETSAGMILPERKDVIRLLEFGETIDLVPEKQDHLLVHCHMGVSRSTAAMATLLLQDHPESDEETIFARILQVRPQMWPNSRMIGFADDILGRRGRFSAALRKLYGHQCRVRPDIPQMIRMYGRGAEVDSAVHA